MIKMPIPFPDRGIPLLLKAGSWLVNKLKDIFDKKGPIEEQKPVQVENAEASDISSLNANLLAYRREIKEVTDELEKEMIEYCDSFFEKINKLLESANASYQLFSADRLKRKFDRTTSRIQGTFEMHTAKRISLDDSECIAVLKMLPGEAKGQRMQELKKRVFLEAVDLITDRISETVNDIMDDMEQSIAMRLENAAAQIEEKSEAYKQLTASAEEQKQTQESIQMHAQFTAALCEFTMKERTCNG